MANNQSVRRHLDAFSRGRIIGKLEEGRSVTSVAADRLHGDGLFARRPVWCVPLTPAHRRRRSLWCREHRNWRDNEWGRVLFTEDSRFSLSSDSHRILIWREGGSRNHSSNIIERDRYGGHGVLVWGGIMLGSRTDLHIFDAGSVNGTRYCNEILLPHVRLFRGAMGLQFFFMDDNAPCQRTVAAEQLLESECYTYCQMNSLAASVKLTYSSSMVDRLTDFCLKVRHEIGVSSIKVMNPPIDTRSSLFVAKSESE
ncbi:transposable element Tcb2 transposase [Trichonephila clavipes]|uniref:Transposable element Tcb2 transposase n=1 Tax=Trichonephila clavipes TaxID=2585209 RepID=A0A8X6VNG9_TRICX|nr:transposable element Tcb2 transposase [Trichonephila clavipes]